MVWLFDQGRMVRADQYIPVKKQIILIAMSVSVMFGSPVDCFDNN